MKNIATKTTQQCKQNTVKPGQQCKGFPVQHRRRIGNTCQTPGAHLTHTSPTKIVCLVLFMCCAGMPQVPS